MRGWCATRQRIGDQAPATGAAKRSSLTLRQTKPSSAKGSPAGFSQQSFARVASEPQQREHEHCRREIGRAGKRVGQAGREQHDEHEPGAAERDMKVSAPLRRAHRIGTFTTCVNCSNSDTRSTISICQVPAGLSTAELST